MRRRKRRSVDRRLRVGAVGAAVAAGAGAFALVRGRLRGRKGGQAEPADAPQSTDDYGTEARCECGQAFRVSGQGRHRVVWVEGAAPQDPLLAQRCPACDRELALLDA